ncbi:hypothetical protein BDR07DRAFT_1407553 [Suillus spraguei]|nr:hypothetical protein BDR07DRAFT_1407553 [Suillus spraguei]
MIIPRLNQPTMTVQTCSVLGVSFSLIHSILLQVGDLLASALRAIIQASIVLALNCNMQIHVCIT